MNERDLDSVIDTATREIARREPSRVLRHAVMARVREPDIRAPRRLVWATGVAIAMLCAAIAIALMNRGGSTQTDDENVQLKPDAIMRSVELEPDPSSSSVRLQPDVEVTPRRTDAGGPARRVRPMTFPPNDLRLSIEPIVAEPLQLVSIDLAPLENQETPVEALTIEPLTIEPLTASND
jgi:hypothetical protein